MTQMAIPAAEDLVARLREAREAVRLAADLPKVSRVVRDVLERLARPDASLPPIVATIERDPILAAQVLRLANSPYYGGRRRVGSVGEAVGLVGTQALRTLVLAGGVAAAFQRLPGVDLRRFWLDATAAGHAARRLARLVDADGEAAFVGGLLHGVGHLVLCHLHREQLTEAFDSVRPLRGAALAAVERERTGLAHPEVGAAWLDGLELPEPIVRAIACRLDAATPADPPLASLLRLACQLAAALDDGVDARTAVAALDARTLAMLDGRRGGSGAPPLAEGMVSLAQELRTAAADRDGS
jgi:HD-like signal output (HDOD) protein